MLMLFPYYQEESYSTLTLTHLIDFTARDLILWENAIRDYQPTSAIGYRQIGTHLRTYGIPYTNVGSDGP